MNKEYEYVGSVDVDAGIVHIGDPCYILPCERFKKLGQEKPGLDYDNYLDSLKKEPITFNKASLVIRNDYKSEEEYTVAWLQAWAEGVEEQKLNLKEFYKTAGADQLKHSSGNKGLGICLSNFGGDGSYPVYVKRNKNGMITEAKIVFNGED